MTAGLGLRCRAPCPTAREALSKKWISEFLAKRFKLKSLSKSDTPDDPHEDKALPLGWRGCACAGHVAST